MTKRGGGEASNRTHAPTRCARQENGEERRAMEITTTTSSSRRSSDAQCRGGREGAAEKTSDELRKKRKGRRREKKVSGNAHKTANSDVAAAGSLRMRSVCVFASVLTTR